ncbi:Elongation factor 3 [Venturia inaequalis]|nr:Elongation factor 3 [Venturia inaequalis]
MQTIRNQGSRANHSRVAAPDQIGKWKVAKASDEASLALAIYKQSVRDVRHEHRKLQDDYADMEIAFGENAVRFEAELGAVEDLVHKQAVRIKKLE